MMFPYFYMYDYSYLVYILPGLILAFYAQAKISSAYEKYSKIGSSTNLSGAEVAREILDRNGLNYVKINLVDGKLSDHYDPRDKTLNLSRDVYYKNSIASVSIAAHEVGHAIQDSVEYAPLKIRGALVPLANLGTQVSFLLIILGFFFSVFFTKLGVALFFFAVLFQIVTLPVEFNASNRAKKELANGIITEEDLTGTKEVLNAAALTYVASTIVAIGQFLRLLSIFGRRD
ncbi:MAG: zinc metallopeptidase [Peptoniphilaceae bacterium]|uniref:zinc metallopeptidase n=1 Tax=Peptoniphilus sp. TaxID=1971214 RepID=UPI002978249F|nr:zinc metallopeptidase [Peptoniphilus sp.]MDD7352153.1 zinc metallopeptidase [Peptoniphilaceae bacterium]MDY3902813.1 zinc metallopeptidase [Peptoniphilus sp.]